MRAPPSPGVPPKRAKVGAGGGAAAGAPVFLRPLKDAAVLAGSDVRLRVAVSGTPQPSLSWFRDGQPLPPQAPEPSCLWLRSCRAQDAGVYSCRAQNERGQASCEAVLTVLEVGGNGEAGVPGGEGCSEPVKDCQATWGGPGAPRSLPRCSGFLAVLTQKCPSRGKCVLGGKGCQSREVSPTGRSEVKGQHLVSKT